jgi:hypothetical protein
MNMTTESGGRQWFPPAKIAAALLLLILCTKVEGMQAQESSSGDQKLTLSNAVDLALKQNLDIQVANIDTAAAGPCDCALGTAAARELRGR